MKPAACHPDHRRPAMVLIIVVVVMVMLSLAGLSFVATMHTENKAAHVQGRRLQLEHVVGSGAELLKSFCQQSWADQQEAGAGGITRTGFGACWCWRTKPRAAAAASASCRRRGKTAQ